MVNPAVREPQQERGWATRQRILEAAIESLAELGWTASTVAVIANRAGVSRGATQHHFPTRESLFAAAVEYVTEIRLDEIRRGAAELPSGPRRTEAILTMLAGLYTGTLFKATLHMWVAAATEPALHDLVVRLERHVGRQAHRAAIDLLGADEAAPGVRQTVQGALDMARGLGLANLLTDDTNRREPILRRWAQILEHVLR
ncbi:MAG: TetR family transcriptional regulator [Actinophytocola sp.]|nr:TetR family transcriptional regulator [Actinophytocola sp.]